MSNLLGILRFRPGAAMDGKKRTPIIMEIPVIPDTAPYLVTSTTGVMWIEEPHPGNIIKAAVRVAPPADIFRAMLEAVIERGRQDDWGNVHFFTPTGLTAAIEHVRSYNLGELEVLIPRSRTDIKLKDRKTAQKAISLKVKPEWLHPAAIGLPIRPTSWLPDDCAVVLPRDRDFVGVLGHVSPRDLFAVAHNPSRGIGIAYGNG